MDSPSSERTSSTVDSQPTAVFKFTAPDSADDGSTQTLSSEDNEDTCGHMMELLSSPDSKMKVSDKYRGIVTWAAKRQSKNNIIVSDARPAKRRKIQVAECSSCHATLHRPYVCLLCNFGGCWKEGHILSHMKDSGHGFCVDVESGNVYCFGCDDFIHSVDFDKLHQASSLRVEESLTSFRETKSKNRRLFFKPWTASTEENKLLQRSKVVSCQGQRGLLNLGQTCYLNVILQTFIHNPLVRNHFLSDRHPHELCKNSQPCLCCEMDKFFTELYSSAQPYGPVSLLHSMWLKSAEMSGYQQQDAHEFFIALLNQIHSTSIGSTSISCVCIVHSTFAGQLQSDVECKSCKNVTTQVDMVLDINLDLGGRPHMQSDDNTLAACLRRFTHPEKLESRCSQCGNPKNEATKRLSIRKLPPVLCFSFKRFKHDATATKIDAHVRFPAHINMAPFTSLVTGAKADPSLLGPLAQYDYELFAVVNHEGQMNNGHYTNFARFEDNWYRYDDEKVSPSTLQDCLQSRAYMCFYVKRHLDYKHHQIPSYIVAQQQAAQREKQKAEETKKD